jgi:ABC-type uncharacterized transport system, permease component
VELCAVRFRQELFSRHHRSATHQGETAGFHFARYLADASDLPHLDPAWHPQGIKDGSQFDVWTSGAIIIGYAIPGFLFAILLIILFAGGSFFNLFPLRGLTSDNWEQLSLSGKVLDYFWHLVLPITSMGLAAFATMTLLTKNSFLDEIRKQYVLTARAKGCTERQVLYGHVFRNAMLIVTRRFSQRVRARVFLRIAADRDDLLARRYRPARIRERAQPRLCRGVCHALHHVAGRVVVNLISDLTYTWVDPRIDFETREV